VKPRLIDRLDLLAAASEARWLQEIARHDRALEQAKRQRRLLAEYRDKLWQSWQGGAVVEAGAARRAADFLAASRIAEQQIEQMERQATQHLERAHLGFAQTQERRRGLDGARREARVIAERTTAQRLERALALPRPAQARQTQETQIREAQSQARQSGERRLTARQAGRPHFE
jgi:hypothetical protein